MKGYLLVVAALLCGGPAYGQAQALTTTTGVAVFRYADPGRLTIEVGVWGAVPMPGQYQVEPGVELLTLLNLAGGPELGVQQHETVRALSIRISRAGQGGRAVIFEALLDDLTSRGRTHPPLQDGDILMVQVTQHHRLSWRDVLGVAGSIGTLALLGLRIAGSR